MATDPLPEPPSEKVFREARHYFAMHNRPVLGYCGGADSNLLLELLAPLGSLRVGLLNGFYCVGCGRDRRPKGSARLRHAVSIAFESE